MKEKLQKQLQSLIQEREAAVATVQNYNGAITIVQKLLNEVTAADEGQQELSKPASKKSKVLTVTPTSAVTE